MPLRLLTAACALAVLAMATPASAKSADPPVVKITKTDAEWKQRLTPQQFWILRQEGTEVPFTGKYWNEHRKGVYQCAACGLDLFSSSAKFESGTGWPSFWQPVAASHVAHRSDETLGMDRDEILCARCGGHLGHVFDDGPQPTGLRYCMNSAAMTFVPAK